MGNHNIYPRVSDLYSQVAAAKPRYTASTLSICTNVRFLKKSVWEILPVPGASLAVPELLAKPARCSLAPSVDCPAAISESEHTAWETFASLPPRGLGKSQTLLTVSLPFPTPSLLLPVSSGLNRRRISEPIVSTAPHSRAALLPSGAPARNVHTCTQTTEGERSLNASGTELHYMELCGYL